MYFMSKFTRHDFLVVKSRWCYYHSVIIIIKNLKFAYSLGEVGNLLIVFLAALHPRAYNVLCFESFTIKHTPMLT